MLVTYKPAPCPAGAAKQANCSDAHVSLSANGVAWRAASSAAAFTVQDGGGGAGLVHDPGSGKWTLFQTTVQKLAHPKPIADNLGDGFRRVVTSRTSSDGKAWSVASAADTLQPWLSKGAPSDPPETELFGMNPFVYGGRVAASVMLYAPSPAWPGANPAAPASPPKKPPKKPSPPPPPAWLPAPAMRQEWWVAQPAKSAARRSPLATGRVLFKWEAAACPRRVTCRAARVGRRGHVDKAVFGADAAPGQRRRARGGAGRRAPGGGAHARAADGTADGA